MKNIVVAYDFDHTIGRNNQLPWAGQLPADMRRFKEITEGSTVIMGRKTFESLPEAFRPLPNRQNIVVSLTQTAFKGATSAGSIDEAFSNAEHDAFIIGGAQVYKQALPLVDRVFATEIETRTQNGDVFFPTLSLDEWKIDKLQTFNPDEKNQFAYSFVTYLRRNPIDIGS
jgi:dihydrofolate reductase